jgi:molybdopterin synthase catalytic subunit
VVNRVVDDVVERGRVLLLGLDHPGVEPAAEDVVAPPVPLVERARVTAVQVAHSIGEVRLRRLDYEVVVVAEQAVHVSPPAVAALNAPQEAEEGRSIVVVAEDRREVVAARRDVVVRAGGEVPVWTAHLRRR